MDLQWRAEKPVVHVGNVIGFGLYAVSDDETDQGFVGVQAIFVWDPDSMELTGLDEGPIKWTVSEFPADALGDGLNADCVLEPDCGLDATCGPNGFCDPFSELPDNDGDAVYFSILIPVPDPRPMATPQGTLVVTITFLALVPGETELVFLQGGKDDGLSTLTRVVDFFDGSSDEVTGALRPGAVIIAECGTRGDFDKNCVVNLDDHFWFADCLSGPQAGPLPAACEPADIDGDGDADLHDAALLQLIFHPAE